MKANTSSLAIFGAGRIGTIHGRNIAAMPSAQVKFVCDLNLAAAQRLAQEISAHATTDSNLIWNDRDIEGVIIASSSDSHADLLAGSVAAQKAVFCEKPLDTSIGRIPINNDRVTGVPVVVGFHRRFDQDFITLKSHVDRGDLGVLMSMRLTSRDIVPPSAQYLSASGGIFFDMMIHDFDMARWLANEDPIEVSAQTSCVGNSEMKVIGEAEVAMAVLRMPSGVLCQIEASRRSPCGYDQRVEVVGSRGVLRLENPGPSPIQWSNKEGMFQSSRLGDFSARYTEAYRAEMAHFIATIRGKERSRCDTKDGHKALIIADAALRSAQKGVSIALESNA